MVDENLIYGINELKKIGWDNILELEIVENEDVTDYYAINAILLDGDKENILDGLSYSEVNWYCDKLSGLIDE